MSHANKVTFSFLSPNNALKTILKLIYIVYTCDYKVRVNFILHSYDFLNPKSINMVLCNTLTKL